MTSAPSPPSVLSPPVITGAPLAGYRLHATTGRVAGTAPLTLTEQWQRGRATCVTIAGVTGRTSTPRHADVGARLTLVVTVANALGRLTAGSARTGVVLTVAQARSRLGRGLTAHGSIRRRALPAHGYAVSLTGPGPGTLTVTWRAGQTVIARGTVVLTGAANRSLRLRLTAAGRRRVARGGRLILRGRGVLTVTGGAAVVVTFRVVVR